MERIVHFPGPTLGLETLCRLCGQQMARMVWDEDKPIVESRGESTTVWYAIDPIELLTNLDLQYCSPVERM